MKLIRCLHLQLLLLLSSGETWVWVSSCMANRVERSRLRSTSESTKEASRSPLELNSGSETLAITNGLKMEKNDVVYGHIVVPDFDSDHELIVTAFWRGDKREVVVPILMFVSKESVPSADHFEKASIGFASRRYARVRWPHVTPGHFFVQLEARYSVANVSISVELRASRRPKVFEINDNSIFDHMVGRRFGPPVP